MKQSGEYGPHTGLLLPGRVTHVLWRYQHSCILLNQSESWGMQFCHENAFSTFIWFSLLPVWIEDLCPNLPRRTHLSQKRLEIKAESMQTERGGSIQLLTLEIGWSNKTMPFEPGYFPENVSKFPHAPFKHLKAKPILRSDLQSERKMVWHKTNWKTHPSGPWK